MLIAPPVLLPNPAGTARPGVGVPRDESRARLQGPERQLSEAVERALRQPAGKLAIVLHLSRLAAPRAYHVRVARVLMQDCAQRCGGQVFAMRSHDLVLLCAGDPAGQPGENPHAPTRLPAILARIFAIDLQQGFHLTSLWRLDQEPEAIDTYLRAGGKEGQFHAPPPMPDQPVSLAALEEIIAKAPLAGLVVQQTGLSLSQDRGLALEARLAPAFQSLSVSLDRLNLARLVEEATSDPFLARHCAATLDDRLLQLLQTDLLAGRLLLRSATAQGLPVMLQLGLRTILTPGFASFARQAASAGVSLWIGVSLLEAGAELDLLDHARGLLRMTACSLVINQVAPPALRLVRLASLAPDRVVLNWSEHLRQDAGVTAWLDSLHPGEAGAVLAGVDSAQALAWGQAHGITLFVGPFLDRVQTAQRMQRCHSAAGCTLAQCLGRAAALAAPGRLGCANPALLEAGVCA